MYNDLLYIAAKLKACYINCNIFKTAEEF